MNRYRNWSLASAVIATAVLCIHGAHADPKSYLRPETIPAPPDNTPTAARIDLAPLWHKALELVGAYAYGDEHVDGERVRTFELAAGLARRVDLAPLLSAVYPLSRWREAVDHALDAGRLDAVKIAFAPNMRRSG